MALTPFPEDFPNRGLFRVYDRGWNQVGYAAEPQYNGQQPVSYPEDATLLEIQLGGYVR